MESIISKRSPERIVGYDFARSLAIFGMIVVNFKIVMKADNNGPQYLIDLLSLIEGKAAATFVVLAGVGVSLMTRNWDENTKWVLRKKLIKRAGFLFVLGFSFTIIWPADILHFYAFYMLVAAFLFTANSRTLKIWFLIFVSIFLFLLFIIDFEQGWDFDKLEYTDFWTLEGLIRSTFYNGFHPIFPWSAFLIAGLWLGRQDIRKIDVQKRIMNSGLFLIIIASTLSLFGNRIFQFHDVTYVFGTQPIPPFPLFILIGTGTAFVTIVVSIKITTKWGQNELIRWVVETGQLALTNYILHVVIGLGVLDLFGVLTIQNGHSLWIALFYSILFYTILIIFSHTWKKYYSRGPFEMLMRKLS